MADEIDRKENSTEPLPEGEDSEPRDVVTEMERLVAHKDEMLARANARLIELEQVVVSKDDEIATLNQTKTDLEGKLASISNSLTEAVTSYKAMVVQANPEVIEELVSGDSIEAINESLSKVKTLVSKVKQGIEAEISLAKVPAGAPGRTLPDFSSLSPQEKIKYAIGGKR